MKLPLEAGAFCGQLVRRSEVAGLLLTEHVYAPGLTLPWHTHENAYFSLLLQGSYSETYGRRDRACGPLNMIYHPAGEAHADRFENHGGRIFHIEAGERFWSLADEHSLRLDVPADFRGGPPPSLALRMHREFQEMDSVSPLVMEGLALEIMGEVARSTTCGIVRRPPQWLSRAVDLIQDRFAETLHLEVIAAEVGVHPSHLARGFRAHHDCTVGEYVRRIRIQRASGLLANTEIPLVEIALQLGFADQAHFSRTFRRVTGRNPGEYRRTFRNC